MNFTDWVQAHRRSVLFLVTVLVLGGLGAIATLPLTAAIAKLAHQFLLLGSDRHHGLPLPLEGLGPAVDVLELRIPIWVGAALQRLAVGLQTIAQVMEESVDRPFTHPLPLGREGHGQRGRALTGRVGHQPSHAHAAPGDDV